MRRLTFSSESLKALSALTGFLFFGCGATGGAVDGPSDTHCGSTVVTVDPNLCNAAETGTGSDDVPTRYGSSADDDDCKYHVIWTSTPIQENRDVTFTLVVRAKRDGQPVTGADPFPEVFLSDTHPAPNSSPVASEVNPGTYTVGPVRFDRRGTWTARFHFFAACSDATASPHGHVAFYVDVP